MKGDVMRASLAVAALLVSGSVTTALVGAQVRTPTPGLTVWVDIDFKGARQTFTSDTPDLTPTGLGKMISSLSVGRGESWQVCREPNYGGVCQIVTQAVPNLTAFEGWNDAIMSVRRTPKTITPPRPAAPGTAAPPPVNPGPARGLELYAGTNFSGRMQVFREAAANLRAMDFNDRAMSLRVPRGETWEICNNTDFDDCRLVSEDIPDLAGMGFTRLISSARPHLARGGSGRPQIVFYDAMNFRGRSLTIDDDRPSVSLSNASSGSIRVTGEWQVCDRPRFYGNCVVVSDDVRDVSRLGLRGPVSSVRRNQVR
jgi:hypothetical protein